MEQKLKFVANERGSCRTYSTDAFIPDECFNERVAGHEAIVIFAKNVASDIQSSVHGKVNCHYNTFTDTMEITISNRVLNIEPFRYSYMYFSREMKHGISSSVIARFVVKEYKEYIDLYIFKRY